MNSSADRDCLLLSDYLHKSSQTSAGIRTQNPHRKALRLLLVHDGFIDDHIS
jgi:hypothetical protein